MNEEDPNISSPWPPEALLKLQVSCKAVSKEDDDRQEGRASADVASSAAPSVTKSRFGSQK